MFYNHIVVYPHTITEFMIQQTKANIFWEVVNPPTVFNSIKYLLKKKKYSKGKTVMKTQDDLNAEFSKPKLDPTKFFSKLTVVIFPVLMSIGFTPTASVLMLIFLTIKFGLAILFVGNYYDLKNVDISLKFRKFSTHVIAISVMMAISRYRQIMMLLFWWVPTINAKIDPYPEIDLSHELRI